MARPATASWARRSLADVVPSLALGISKQLLMLNAAVIEEVLQVDHGLAVRIWEFLLWPPPDGTLEGLDGVTPALADEIRKRLVVPVQE